MGGAGRDRQQLGGAEWGLGGPPVLLDVLRMHPFRAAGLLLLYVWQVLL